MFSRISRSMIAAAAMLCPAMAANAQITALPGHAATSVVTGAEYFFDTDPGYGAGQQLSIGPAADISSSQVIPINTLSWNAHRLFIRSRNSAGVWSMTHSDVFVIYSMLQALPQHLNGPAVVDAEYFIDTDPGPGRGTAVALPGTGNDLTAANVAVDLSGLSLGVHRVFFRARNADGMWSLSTASQFAILINTVSTLPAHPVGRPVTAVEYFIDTDPGYGNGTILSIPATTDLANQTVAVDISTLAKGTHTLFFRSINGHSMTTAQTFTIGGTALPLSWLNLGVRSEGSAAVVSWNVAQTAASGAYSIERSSDGKQFSPVGTQEALGGASTASYSFRDESPLPGQSYYRIRLENTGGDAQYSAVLNLRRSESDAEIRISNPVSNTLTIKRLGDGAERLDLSIRNLAGQEVAHPGRGGVLQQVDLSSLPAGMYLLGWQQAGEPRMLRFVKQ